MENTMHAESPNRLDRLAHIEVFLAIARARSFTKAARQLGISRGSATKYVSALEETLGARLLNRSTAHVSITEAGEALLKHGSAIFDHLEQLVEDVRSSVADLHGLIRIGTPPSFGASHLVPAVSAFRAANPGIAFFISVDDGDKDLLKDGLDLSLRIASGLRDMSHVAQRLVGAPQVLVASPSYLAQRGRPKCLEDLADHACLVHQLKSPNDHWNFEGETSVSVKVNAMLRSNLGEALKQSAILGDGISMHPTYMVAADIEAKRLEVVLPQFQPLNLDVYALYPRRRHLPKRVRIFIDFLKEKLGSEPSTLPD